METKNQLPYLPHDLITRILLRLPVKSLIRFKCVCKSWFSLISSDTHFANSQFELNAATHGHRVLFISTSTHETRSVDLEASLDDDTASVSLNPINFIPSEPYPFIEIKGSCRGFILLLCHPTFYIWNPSTGFHKNIPLSPLGLNLDTEYFYGFGYDQSTDDYLMVLMSSHTNSSYLELFSLRANTWKQIDEGTNFHYLNAIPAYIGKPRSLFNGVIHWLAYRRDLLEDVIVTFDLMEKKLLVIHLPDQFDLEIDFYSGLWEFREYLSLWALNYENNTVEIWVMKEYRVHSSWTKTHVLSIDALPAKYFSPLSCTKIGDIVGTNGHFRLAKYNDVGQLLGHRSYSNHPHGCHVVMYSESLLSLPEINVQA